MKVAHNEVRLVDNLCVEASKSLFITKSRNKELALKLVTAVKDQKSAEAGLKNAEAQMEEQG